MILSVKFVIKVLRKNQIYQGTKKNTSTLLLRICSNAPTAITLSRKDTFKRHFSAVHENNPPAKKRKLERNGFFCAICKSSFDDKDSVVNHYMSDHDLLIKIEGIDFDNKIDFIKWKKIEENSTGCAFVKHSSSCTDVLGNNTTTFFVTAMVSLSQLEKIFVT